MPTPRDVGGTTGSLGACGGPSACGGTSSPNPQRKPSNRFMTEKPVDVRLDQLRSYIEKQDAWLKEHMAAMENQMGSMASRLDRLVAYTNGELPNAAPIPVTVQTKNDQAIRESAERLSQEVMQLLSLSGFSGAQADGLAAVNQLVEASKVDAKPAQSNLEVAAQGKDSAKAAQGAVVPVRQGLPHGHSAQSKSLEEPSIAKQVSSPLYLDVIPAAVVMLNALVIGVSSDVWKDSTFWQILEIFFTVAFTAEAGLKMYLFGCREYCCGKDKFWNWFDLFCISTAYADLAVTVIATAIMGNEENPEMGGFMLLKMLRLARLSRLIRLLRFKIFIELKMMVLGVVSGIRVLFWAIILLFAIVYLLGVVTRKTIGEAYDEFKDVSSAMFTIFRCFTDGCSAYNGTPLQESLRADYGFGFMVVYILVFLLITFGLFNLIMAIFIDNVVTAQADKKRNELGEATDMVRRLIEKVIWKLAGGDREPLDSNFAVERDTFLEWMDDHEMKQVLETAGIESATKHEMFDVLDVNVNGTLGFDEIVDGMMRLRGDVTKSDIVAVRMKVRYMTKILEDALVQIQRMK
eukprot:TRINITY_DN14365_c0_g1_i1.p1 TRINITY_DN14365_c0_g1~~TRINITY_DN14365_c0_g1_i1.p1  ORF type:complete len:576 (-),score=95.94 TRINITY_DN14365_c0_g1_i1:19-1746(-)